MPLLSQAAKSWKLFVHSCTDAAAVAVSAPVAAFVAVLVAALLPACVTAVAINRSSALVAGIAAVSFMVAVL